MPSNNSWWGDRIEIDVTSQKWQQVAICRDLKRQNHKRTHTFHQVQSGPTIHSDLSLPMYLPPTWSNTPSAAESNKFFRGAKAHGLLFFTNNSCQNSRKLSPLDKWGLQATSGLWWRAYNRGEGGEVMQTYSEHTERKSLCKQVGRARCQTQLPSSWGLQVFDGSSSPNVGFGSLKNDASWLVYNYCVNMSWSGWDWFN